MSYIGLATANASQSNITSVLKQSKFNRSYVSTGGETNFIITFNNDDVDVILNGIHLKKYDDYTPLNNNTISLIEPTSYGDIVQCIGYYTFNTQAVSATVDDVNHAILQSNSIVSSINTILGDGNLSLLVASTANLSDLNSNNAFIDNVYSTNITNSNLIDTSNLVSITIHANEIYSDNIISTSFNTSLFITSELESSNSTILNLYNETLTSNNVHANTVYVSGDLFVSGNTISLGTQSLYVEDNIVVFGSNNISDITDLGFATKYNDGANDLYAGLVRDATDGKFYLFKDYNIEPPVSTLVGLTIPSMLATLYGDFEANNIVIENGTANNLIVTTLTSTHSILENVDVEILDANNATVNTLIAYTSTLNNLNVESITTNDITSNTISVNTFVSIDNTLENITANNVDISTLVFNQSNGDIFGANTVDIFDRGTAVNFNVDNLTADYSYLDNIHSNSLLSVSGTIDVLNSNNITTVVFNSTNSILENTTANNIGIYSLIAQNSTLIDASIANGEVINLESQTGYIETLNANNVTISTLDTTNASVENIQANNINATSYTNVDYNNLINKPDARFQEIEDAAFINSIIFG